jgi:hypothetical protein
MGVMLVPDVHGARRRGKGTRQRLAVATPRLQMGTMTLWAGALVAYLRSRSMGSTTG